MKESEWYYDHSTKEWWMVTVATNSNRIPKLKMPESAQKGKPNAKIYGINLVGENSKLWRIIFALSGCVGVSLAIIAFLLCNNS
tara:strand:+ start:3079 stop:3330 length:252 start_codon:yes stop_codon:yes gene_type:complete